MYVTRWPPVMSRVICMTLRISRPTTLIHPPTGGSQARLTGTRCFAGREISEATARFAGLQPAFRGASAALRTLGACRFPVRGAPAWGGPGRRGDSGVTAVRVASGLPDAAGQPRDAHTPVGWLGRGMFSLDRTGN